MSGIVFSKTAFGVDELQQRQMRLHPRLRTLLVMVDGKQTGTQLVQTLAAAGITEEHLQQLQDAGLIQPIHGGAGPQPVVPPVAVAGTAEDGSGRDKPAQTPATLMAMPPEKIPSDESGRLMGLFRIYGEVIGTVGSDGRPLRKKLDKAASIRDYISLGNEIITLLNRSSRVEQAVAFKVRVKPYLR